MHNEPVVASGDPCAELTGTPDFYDYAWIVPARVAIEGRTVRISWPDGCELAAFDLWMHENVVGSGVDAATREGLLDPADLDPSLRVIQASIDARGAVAVSFSDGSSGRFHPGWLHHVAKGLHRPDAWLPEPVTWTPATLPVPPSHDGATVLTDDDARAAWLHDLLSLGLARLQDLPDDPDVGRRVAARLGPIRDTNFGQLWDVKADISLAGASATNSTANTNLRLGPHTDLPTRETPPGFQFLHCFANEAEGGWSTMADGRAVVAEFADTDPELYEAACTMRWIFFNRGPGIDHRWSGPLIDHGLPGAPLTLRAFYPVRGFPDMAAEDMPLAYEALRAFSRLAASERFQLSFPFEPGDMVGFDNRRILHGRNAFTAGGVRHLRGFYIDHDDVRSAGRVASRRGAAASTTAFTAKEKR